VSKKARYCGCHSFKRLEQLLYQAIQSTRKAFEPGVFFEDGTVFESVPVDENGEYRSTEINRLDYYFFSRLTKHAYSGAPASDGVQICGLGKRQ
jgi:hypothetical protein